MCWGRGEDNGTRKLCFCCGIEDVAGVIAAKGDRDRRLIQRVCSSAKGELGAQRGDMTRPRPMLSK